MSFIQIFGLFCFVCLTAYQPFMGCLKNSPYLLNDHVFTQPLLPQAGYDTKSTFILFMFSFS